MNTPTDFQVLHGQNGQPAFYVIPAAAFERIRPMLEAQLARDGVPQSVVEAHVLHDVPLVRAWREHLGLTQQEVCRRAKMLQPALARIEAGSRPRRSTIEKLASAMGLSADQLTA